MEEKMKQNIAKLLKVKEKEILSCCKKGDDWEVDTTKGSYLVTKDFGSFHKHSCCRATVGRNETGHYLPASGGPN